MGGDHFRRSKCGMWFSTLTTAVCLLWGWKDMVQAFVSWRHNYVSSYKSSLMLTKRQIPTGMVAVSFLELYKTFTRKHSRINYGNVSAWVNGFAQRLTFLVWIHSPLRGIGGCDCCSRCGTLQLAVWSQGQGVQVQVAMPWCTTAE